MDRSMYVSRATHYRKGRTIVHIMSGEREAFRSISKAKKRSRQMQQEDKKVIVVRVDR